MIKWDTRLIFFIIHIFTESLLLCSINSYACLLRESSPKNEKSVIVYSLWLLIVWIVWSKPICRKPVWRRYFEECPLMGPIDFHSIYLFIFSYGGWWGPSSSFGFLLIGYHAGFLQNIYFCVQQKNETHTGLKQLEVEGE